MVATVYSGALYGLESIPVRIEVDMSPRGLPAITIVGLPNKAVAESKERVLSALTNSHFSPPLHRTTINLSPADVPKEGALYDLPIALGILAAQGVIKPETLSSYFFAGELSLSGAITPVKGIIPLVMLAKKMQCSTVVIPALNAEEVRIIKGIAIYPVHKLSDIVLHINNDSRLTPLSTKSINEIMHQEVHAMDFCDIIGQQQAKRALEIAAAGFHNVLLHGPPGTGKTLLSRALPSILPPLSGAEVIETTKIYSISGLLNEQKPIILYPPFRNPHHTISRIGLIGGGSKPMPGEISLSHRGVLFLDEMAEFPRSALEALRQPLEDGTVTIARASGSATFPARFILIAATNPCPCGNLGNPKKECVCSASQIVQYKKRLSGPILDRIDMHILVPHIQTHELSSKKTTSEKSAIIRQRVIKARERQHTRLARGTIATNGEMGTREVQQLCALTTEAETLLKKAIDVHNLSVRAYFKIIKVAQTIADLAEQEIIDTPHVAEALQYRISE